MTLLNSELSLDADDDIYVVESTTRKNYLCYYIYKMRKVPCVCLRLCNVT